MRRITTYVAVEWVEHEARDGENRHFLVVAATHAASAAVVLVTASTATGAAWRLFTWAAGV